MADDPGGTHDEALGRQIASLRQGDHLCSLYETPEEQLAVAIPFMTVGLARGERCLYIADERTVKETEEALSKAGVDVAKEQGRGALQILTKRETYLQNGRFEPAAMARLLHAETERAVADGFSGLRATGEMTWAMGTEAGCDRLVEYEAQLNEFFAGSRTLAICQYNRSRFASSVLREILRTHPIAILGTDVCRNPYYEPAPSVLGSFSEDDRLDWMISRLREASRAEEERAARARALGTASLYNRSLIEASLDPLVTIGRDGKITDANVATETVTGQSRRGLVGTDFSDYFTEPERAAAGYRKVFEDGQVRDYPLEIRHSDGSVVPVLYNASVYRNESGGVMGVFATARDITRLKQVEDALRKSEATLQEAEHLAHLGSWSWDLQEERARWSKELYDILGREPSFRPNHANLLQSIHPEDRGRVDAAVRTAIEKRDVYDVEYRIVRPDGSIRFIHALGRTHCDPDGKPVYMVGAVHDVTDAKRAQHALEAKTLELERSNADLQQFAYVASHDLQEPLRGVASFAELLAERYREKMGTDADEFIGFIVDGTARMQAMINDLLSYSRVGTHQKAFAPVSADEALDSAIANLQAAIDESHARITRDPMPTVAADQAQLVQVFQNLIGNAIKFRGREAPRVHVGAVERSGEWTFSVRDNGIGIDPKYFARLFRVFQRLHTRGEYTGTGIGLAVCRRIVERHGGRIWIESQPGQGTTFRFTIPKNRGDDRL